MNWKEELKEMKYRHIEKRTPDAFIASGGRTMKLKPYSDATVNGLINCIIDWINFSGGQAIRIAQHQFRKEKIDLAFGNKRELIRFTPTARGSCDIKATIKGNNVKIWVRIGLNRDGDNKNKDVSVVDAAGAHCFVARDMQGFVQWLTSTFGNSNVRTLSITQH